MTHINDLRLRWRIAHSNTPVVLALDTALSILVSRRLYYAFVGAKRAADLMQGLTIGIERLLLRQVISVLLGGAVEAFEFVAGRYGYAALRNSAHAFRWLIDRIKELPPC